MAKYLLGVYLILFGILAIQPYDRAVWFAENLPVWIVVLGLVITYHRFKFSNAAYFLMWFFLCYHTIGGHWTFELVPFSYGNELLSQLNFEFLFPEGRNNFDRLGHFLVGVFAYPFAELVYKKGVVKSITTAVIFAIFALGFWAALYEIIETIYAVIEGGATGAAFLGSQGDIWDAQKDMLLDILGAVVFSILFIINYARKS
jgi:putative membrane protein